MIPSIDAHHHLWHARVNSYPYLPNGSRHRMHGKPLPRLYGIEDYLSEAEPAGVVRSVHFQCGWDPSDPVGETRWLETVAREHGFPAIVAHADLTDPDVERTLAAHALASPRLRGIRQHVGWHRNPRYRRGPRPGMLRVPAFKRGFARLQRYQLPFELQIFHDQFDEAIDLAREFRATILLLGNSGTPVDREPEALDAWRTGVHRLATCTNVCAKIGGFSMVEHDWTADSIRPSVNELVDAFGVDRSMFGSNFPVDGLYRPFAAMWSDYHALKAHRPLAERNSLLYEAAARAYRIEA